MKTKRNLITAICLCLSAYCLAGQTTFKERTENWLQKAPSESSNERPEIEDDGNPPVGDPGIPVGEALWLVAGMGAVYTLYHCMPRRKSILTIHEHRSH
jgi:hypothetical protein